MKERPIIFSGEMVRAILAGRKTQTRRVIKPQPVIQDGVAFFKTGQRCPYGQIGDRMWVREAWIRNSGVPAYRADDPSWPGETPKWKPSIHMPRWASRITLEIVNVRVERLQDITVGDAWAEGCPNSDVNVIPDWFIPLWAGINAARGNGWDDNPWVWAIEFKRVGG